MLKEIIASFIQRQNKGKKHRGKSNKKKIITNSCDDIDIIQIEEILREKSKEETLGIDKTIRRENNEDYQYYQEYQENQELEKTGTVNKDKTLEEDKGKEDNNQENVHNGSNIEIKHNHNNSLTTIDSTKNIKEANPNIRLVKSDNNSPIQPPMNKKKTNKKRHQKNKSISMSIDQIVKENKGNLYKTLDKSRSAVLLTMIDNKGKSVKDLDIMISAIKKDAIPAIHRSVAKKNSMKENLHHSIKKMKEEIHSYNSNKKYWSNENVKVEVQIKKIKVASEVYRNDKREIEEHQKDINNIKKQLEGLIIETAIIKKEETKIKESIEIQKKEILSMIKIINKIEKEREKLVAPIKKYEVQKDVIKDKILSKYQNKCEAILNFANLCQEEFK